ncbi:Uncharacterized protein FWK35_00017376 [Aphis craccivora]|uniref:Uncharacterized protein n=1 Tax=Aphis craccivora TaxID=307492 RepID=A0A6G0YVX4_APHCR|nr:Uncharacterized protein FWK35_00017376 [Aphis craccivora]
MALRDHDYIIPANHEEVGVPNLNLFLQDHTYVQHPAIQILPQHEEQQEQKRQARTYRAIPGVRLNSKFYVDNFGYKYYQKKIRVNRITLICERQKNPNRPTCYGSASISRNKMDNQILISHEIDLNVPFLSNTLGQGRRTYGTCARDRTLLYIPPDIIKNKKDETIKTPTITSKHTRSCTHFERPPECKLCFVTDYERALMNAVLQIFPTKTCYAILSMKIDWCLELGEEVLALPHLSVERGHPGCPNFCMEDGLHTIVNYAFTLNDFLKLMSSLVFLVKFIEPTIT